MFDKELVLLSLSQIKSAIEMIIKRVSVVKHPNDFLLTQDGMLRLDAICMNLIALGESVKGIEKITKGELLSKYPEIYWGGVMRMRDKIAHHYFEIDTDVVFKTLEEDIPTMLPVIERMISDLQK